MDCKINAVRMSDLRILPKSAMKVLPIVCHDSVRNIVTVRTLCIVVYTQRSGRKKCTS